MQAQALIHSANVRGSFRVGRPSAALQQRSLLAVRPSRRDLLRVKAEGEQPGAELDDEFISDSDRKKAAAERLRAAEKFMVVGTGEAQCKGCGYTYTPSKGDPEYPVSPGTKFGDLPEDWNCPVCGAEKRLFESKQKELAGFAENQGYGLGTNSMTTGQKSALIYGSLALFFMFFLLGYTLQ